MTRAALRARGAILAGVLAATPAPLAAAGAEEAPMQQSIKAAGAGALATSLLPSQSSPLVTFRIQFRAGAIDDPPGRHGLNTLTALTIGQGGTQDLTYRQVVDRLYPMAASIGAQPDREVTTFVGEVHRDHLRDFYALLSGVLLKPRFDPADFKRNRDLLLAQIETNLRSNDDEELGKQALNVMMYEGHPYGHPDAGSVQGLKAITLEDVKAHYARHYTRGTVLLGVAGGYPPALLETLRQDFMALPEGAPERPALPAPRPIAGMEILIVEKPVPAVAISIGRPIAVTRSDRDYYALLVAGSYLGEHRTFNGRLMNVMRSDRGLNYGDYAYVENFIQEGGSTFPRSNIPRRQQHFSIWIRPLVPENAPFALRQATRELKRLIDAGLSAEEFETTRKHLLNYSRLWTQSLSRRLGSQMDSQFYGTSFYIDRIQAELASLQLSEVNAAIRRHLNAGDLKVAIVADRGAALRDLLLSGRPTPITYQTPTTREDLLREDKEIESFPLPLAPERVRVVPVRDLFER